MKLLIAFVLSLFMWPVCYLIGKSESQTPETKYFVNGSGKFLNEIRLDLPEEISTVKWDSDSTLDLMSAYLDRKEGVIYLGFTGMEMYKNDWQYANEDPCIIVPRILSGGDISRDLHEYQLELEMDSIILFDHGRYVGTVPYSDTLHMSPLDSLFLKDNL